MSGSCEFKSDVPITLQGLFFTFASILQNKFAYVHFVWILSQYPPSPKGTDYLKEMRNNKTPLSCKDSAPDDFYKGYIFISIR